MTSVCRQSDSAFVQYQNGVSGDLGLIAKTSAPNNGSLDITGNFQIVGEGSAISGTVNKVGRTTGWTQGTITFSCVNVGVSGTNIVQLCQNIVESTSQIVAGGDSGSAVFTIGSGDNVVLEGILWGSFTGGLGFVYSPIANIESELGALTTSGGGSPPPTPTATSPAPTATATQTPTPNPGGNPATMANDDFESNSFNGGSGWLASWATSGNFNIDDGSSSDPHNGSFHLRLRATSNASRSVDVSGASSVRVEFWAKLESFESSDTAQVLVNGNVIQAFANGDDDGIYRFYSIDVTPYLSGSTLDLEFDGTMSSSFDRFFVDDVTIISDAGGSPPPESTETPTPPPSTSTPTATPPPNTATPTATPPPNTATPTATPHRAPRRRRPHCHRARQRRRPHPHRARQRRRPHPTEHRDADGHTATEHGNGDGHTPTEHGNADGYTATEHRNANGHANPRRRTGHTRQRQLRVRWLRRRLRLAGSLGNKRDI